jgi:hypothetical protein
VHVFVAAASNAPMDWVWGTVAALVFVGLIGVPAAALNARDRKRRQQQSGAAPEAQGTR